MGQTVTSRKNKIVLIFSQFFHIDVIGFLSPKVCNDVRSDIESSSEEETDMTTDDLRGSTHIPKGENGTNGHYAAAKARTQNHSSW